jgi:hypothetical protein
LSGVQFLKLKIGFLCVVLLFPELKPFFTLFFLLFLGWHEQPWVQYHKGTKPAMKKQPDTYRSRQFLGL